MDEEKLRRIEGLQTIEIIMKELGISKQSALNLVSKLKKEQYLTNWEGTKKKRIYKITLRKQRPRDPGMFDMINKYSPNMKLNPWFDHQVHGKYGPEEALVDAVKTESPRAILASLRLFSHIKDWKRLYVLAKKEGVWQKIGAMYDVARLFFWTRKMKERYSAKGIKRWVWLTRIKRMNFPEIAKKWKVYISFNEYDVREV